MMAVTGEDYVYVKWLFSRRFAFLSVDGLLYKNSILRGSKLLLVLVKKEKHGKPNLGISILEN